MVEVAQENVVRGTGGPVVAASLEEVSAMSSVEFSSAPDGISVKSYNISNDFRNTSSERASLSGAALVTPTESAPCHPEQVASDQASLFGRMLVGAS